MIEFYASDFWYWERARVLDERGEGCERCGCWPESPHVHHRFGVPEDEGERYTKQPIDTYEVLCPDCHADHHGNEELRNFRKPLKGAAAMNKVPKAPRLKLDVNSEHINNSEQRNSSKCMLARAIETAYPGATRICIDIAHLRWTDPQKQRRLVYPTPRIAQVAIIQFDQGIHLEPFQVQLRKGEVYNAGNKPPARPGTDKQRAQRAAASAAQREQLKKMQLVNRDPLRTPEGEEYLGVLPERVGGKPPPVHSLSVKRKFGLRGFDRIA